MGLVICQRSATVAALLCLAACNDSTEDRAEATTVFTTSEFVAIDAVAQFGAVGDGITDSEPMIQLALDAAAARGGGTVQLPAGIYGIREPLILRSHVHLVGEGQGNTIVRSLVPSLGKVEQEAGVWSAIAMVAADSASVSDLTVDLSFAATHANGIAMLPAGAAFEGTPSTNCDVSKVEVIGGGNYHAYMIWNLRGRNINIMDNVIDGLIMAPVASNQEGIESYGGKDVTVARNVVRNIGNTALNFGSAGLPDTGVERLRVLQNVVSNSGRGLNIGPWLDPSGPQNIADVLIESNEFTDLWNAGMFVPVPRGTEVRGLRIAGNTVRNVGSDTGTAAVGIHFQGAPANGVLPAGAAFDTAVVGNFIANVRGANAIGVVVNHFPNAVLTGNTIVDVNYGGVQAFGSSELQVDGNWFNEIGRIAVGTYGPLSSASIVDNTIMEWDRHDGKVAAVQLDMAVVGEVRGNVFRRERPSGSAVRVEATSTDVVVFGNQLFSGETTAVPYVNLGQPSNLGAFAPAAGETTVMVANALASASSGVIIEQLEGDPLVVSVVPADGVLQVTFATPPAGGERFRFEIDP